MPPMSPLCRDMFSQNVGSSNILQMVKASNVIFQVTKGINLKILSS